MGECNQVATSAVVVLVPKVWNESEDFGRDLVDRCESVPPGPNQAEDFLSQNVELNATRISRNSLVRFVRLTSAMSEAVAILKTQVSASDARYFTTPGVPRVNSRILQKFLGCA